MVVGEKYGIKFVYKKTSEIFGLRGFFMILCFGYLLRRFVF